MKDDDFDKQFNRAARFIKGWFIFCAVASVVTFVGTVYVVYLLLKHFGVLPA